MTKDANPELFTHEVRYERFILVSTFKRLRRQINPHSDESVEPIMGKAPQDGEQVDVVIGVNLSLFTKKGASDAKRLFEAEEGK